MVRALCETTERSRIVQEMLLRGELRCGQATRPGGTRSLLGFLPTEVSSTRHNVYADTTESSRTQARPQQDAIAHHLAAVKDFSSMLGIPVSQPF